jgi:hypothetical protein
LVVAEKGVRAAVMAVQGLEVQEAWAVSGLEVSG